MGVDIDTYRGRIGTFSYQLGLDVVTIVCIVNFSRALKCVGSVAFVCLLLILAGIEQNPGPFLKDKPLFERVLNKSRPKLVANLKIDDVLDVLVADEILTELQARDIREEKKTSDRVRVLLREISTRGNSAYNAFKSSLKRTHQQHLAEHLEEAEKELTDKKSKQETDSDTGPDIGIVSGDGRTLASYENDEFFDSYDGNSVLSRQDDDSDSDQDNFSDAPEYKEPVQLHRDADVERILAKLGLTEKLKSKIKISDVIQIDLYEKDRKETTDQDIPFIFLQRLLSGNSEAMNYKSYHAGNSFCTKGSVNAIYAPEESDDISPLDLFLLVYHCCDPMLKQLIFQKLYLAKLAFPFIYKEYPSSRKVLSVWPLRFLVTETMCETECNEMREIELLDLPVYAVTVARFGRPQFSKSKLLNELLCDSGSETFFHKDRPLGMTARYASRGYVEMFFVPLVSGCYSNFNKPMMFFNIRGDLNKKEHFNLSDRDFIIRTSDTAIIILDSSTLFNAISSLEMNICRFSSVLLLFVSPLGPSDGETYTILRNFEKLVVNRYNLKLHVVATHKGTVEKNSTDIISETKYAISAFINNRVQDLESLGTRISNSFLETDESCSCKRAYESACSVIASVDEISSQRKIVELVTPVQSINSQKLGVLLKEYYRNNNPSSFDDIKYNISMERRLQRTQITPTVKIFTACLIENKTDQSFLQFYLCWLKLLLENKKRLASKNISGTQDIDPSDSANTPEVEENTCLEIGHLFREVGHICDSILCSDIDSESIGFPKVTELGEVVAGLVSEGYTLELLDGDNFLIPTKWLELVLGIVHEKIGKKQVLTLSALGIQSSGKSTLLNIMFGLQFPASSGRCTRGIQLRLIPVKERRNKPIKRTFEHILVIDTEGIRAPEIFDSNETNYRRDNELSTIITGLGDITILNVMGEGITEMREILQILAHAFLRLKLANNKLELRKSCFLVHQNVSDMLAPHKLSTGLNTTVKLLDKATKEAAETEGISDILSFDKVIEFNQKKSVVYLPTLWQGSPPMAPINRKYCERVDKMTTRLLQKSLNEQEKSFKNLKDIVLHVDDLWKGVLAENFVFSFRNSIEKKAYIILEKTMKEELWLLETSFDDELLQMTQNRFSKCDDQDSLRNAKREITAKMQNLLGGHKLKTERNLETFFKDNNYKDTTIKWQAQSMNRLNIFCQGLVDNRNVEIDGLYKKREVDIMINIMCTRHEDELRRKSLELAKELRISTENIGKQESDEKFDQIWKTFVEESLSADTNMKPDYSLKTDFIECLSNIYENHTDLLNPFLKANDLEKSLEIEHLSGSFDKTGITEDDISGTCAVENARKNKQNTLNQTEAHYEFNMAMHATENMFQTIDTKIMQICQKGDVIINRDVKQLLNEVQNLIEDILKKHKQHYTLKITFKFKILVHVSRYSLHRFEKENLAHQQSYGISVRLEKHRKQMEERFYAHLEERKSEDTAATLMHGAIEEFIREKLTESLSWKVKAALKNKLPPLKYHLLLEILNELVAKITFICFCRTYLTQRDVRISGSLE